MTVEQRRKAILRRVETCLDHEYYTGLAEEVFSIADSLHSISVSLEKMAKVQEDALIVRTSPVRRVK